MKTKPDIPLPFKRSFRHSSSLRNPRHLHRINANSVPLFRTSVRYSKTQQEYDLQQKIDLEIKMREGTAKLLAACKHMNQSLEAAKSLLTSDTRLAEFRNELALRKGSQKNKTKRATVHNGNASVSDIRIPLIWKETEYFKNKGDYRRFAVFCLLQMGSEIYDTVMVNVDRNSTDICFEDLFKFHKIHPDFQFKLYVYARVLEDDLSMAPSHKKLTQKITSSVSRSFGRKFSSQMKDFDSESGPKFYLMATAALNLKDASDVIKTYDLTVEEVEKSMQLPLFGDFCCRFAVQPESQLKEFISGLVMYQSAASRGEHALFWCSLKNFRLHLWSVKEELKSEPVFVKHTISNSPASIVVPIGSGTKISLTENNSLTVSNGDASQSHCFRACSGSITDWHRALLACREAFIAWEPIAEYQMELAQFTQPRSNYFLRNRLPGSLYDETPIQELKKRHSKSLSNVSSLDTKYNSFGNSSHLRASKLIN